MRYWIILLALGIGSIVGAQEEARKFELSYDHSAVVVKDLAKSAAFYEEVLGLREIYNGTENDKRRWYDLGHGTALHVIEESTRGIQLTKAVHLSLTVVDFDGFVAYLRDGKVPFETWSGEPMQHNARPDGARQVYLQDPDGYWIEVNDAVTLRQ